MPGSETGGPKGPERITRPKVERRRAAPGPAAAARLEGGLRTPGATLGSLASERTPQTTHTRRGPASTPPPPVSTPDVRPVTPPPAPQPGIEGLRDIDDVGNLRPQVAPIPNSVGDFRRQAPEMDRGAPGATVGRPTAENRGRDSRGQGLRQDQGPLDLSEPTRRPEDTVSNSPKKEPEQPPAGSKTPDTAPSGTDQRLKTPEFTPQEQERIQKEVERRLKEEKYKNATPEELKLMSLENKIQAGIATEDDLKEYRTLKGKDTPEQKRAAVTEKILSGNFSDADAKEYVRLTRTEANVEQNLEQLNKQTEDVMMRILRGQGNLEDNILELHRLKELVDRRSPIMSEKRARELVRRVLNPEDSGLLGKQELALQREIRAKIERLMALDLYLIAEYPQQQDQLQKASEDTKSAIKVKKREVSSGSDEDKLRKRMELYQLYMQLTNVRADRIKLDRAADIMEAEHRDITQYLDRKLGVTNPIMSFVAFADAKVRNAGAYTRAEMDFFTDI